MSEANPISSSKGHNSAERSGAVLLDHAGAEPLCLPDESSGQRSIPFPLSGSQKKTAGALRHNATTMIEEAGVACIGFCTFTLGDRDADGKWIKVFEASEAGRRFNNLARRVLPDIFERFIVVTERHKDGGIHFHALGVLRGRPDVRTGFDHAAAKAGDYSSATGELRKIWALLRSEQVTRLGFGRCEVLPIEKCGEAVASYVAKYIEKNICNRLKADKGKKLVRYHGWNRRQLKPNDFSWCTPKACEWRRNAETIAKANGVKERSEMAGRIGPRWAWRLQKIMGAVQHSRERDAEDVLLVVRDQWQQHEASFVRSVSGERFERNLSAEEWAQVEIDCAWTLPTWERSEFSESENARWPRTLAST